MGRENNMDTDEIAAADEGFKVVELRKLIKVRSSSSSSSSSSVAGTEASKETQTKV